jgi:hypothetical protein
MNSLSIRERVAEGRVRGAFDLKLKPNRKMLEIGKGLFMVEIYRAKQIILCAVAQYFWNAGAGKLRTPAVREWLMKIGTTGGYAV